MTTDQAQAQAEGTITITDNRNDASKADAQVLGRIYRRVSKLIKAHRDSVRDLADGWVGSDLIGLRADRDEAQFALDEALDDSWVKLNALPIGTVAPGGATPQTVGLQLFNRNLNRNLKLRISAKDAREANKRSFA